jgi:4-carboxymuconolactone decarboxylase
MPAERLPPPAPDAITDAQRAAMAELQAGPRGGVVGPFGVLVRSPELMRRVQRVGEHLRFGAVLPRRVFECAVLLVARAYDQAFEWEHHRPLAIAQGVGAEVVAAIETGREPKWEQPADRAAARVVGQLLDHGRVDDDAYADAHAAFGEEGVVELVVTVGYYITLALAMNVAGTPAPGGTTLQALAVDRGALR